MFPRIWACFSAHVRQRSTPLRYTARTREALPRIAHPLRTLARTWIRSPRRPSRASPRRRGSPPAAAGARRSPPRRAQRELCLADFCAPCTAEVRAQRCALRLRLWRAMTLLPFGVRCFRSLLIVQTNKQRFLNVRLCICTSAAALHGPCLHAGLSTIGPAPGQAFISKGQGMKSPKTWGCPRNSAPGCSWQGTCL